ncbi:MAG TPA: SDR family oxidoreductase [Bacteroidales bacterium]|nr:SDR family oxidoreductase [Bacteroidales bacterium]
MDLKISGQYFVVTGAGSGFGRAVAEALLAEGAIVLAVARTAGVLESFCNQYPSGNLHILPGDVTQTETISKIIEWSKNHPISGILVNAGGPPAGGAMEINDEQWDQAYHLVLRWKLSLVQQIALQMAERQYGRILFIESISVKQPVDSLALSNIFRPAVVGFAKSLAREMASKGVTANVLAPGYHNTPAMQRLYRKKADMTGMSIGEAKQQFERQIPTGALAGPEAIASLALWLLSPLSFYVTGQTISHDGGIVHGIFG